MNERQRVWWEDEGRPDWAEWHADYDRAGSALTVRLEIVKGYLRGALDAAPDGLVRLISMCAGQGRDVIEVLATHPRRDDVRARLVELDARNVAYARATATAAGLDQVDVVEGDASITDAYLDAVPADVVLVCGVFGNMVDEDVHATIARLPQFCAPNATVIWTRHRREPDLTPSVLGWFDEAGFAPIDVAAPSETEWVGVGAHRLVGPTKALVAGERIFTFVRDPLDPPSS